ncbi:hypothetical protein D9M69_640800 [compost metagenome]
MPFAGVDILMSDNLLHFRFRMSFPVNIDPFPEREGGHLPAGIPETPPVKFCFLRVSMNFSEAEETKDKPQE